MTSPERVETDVPTPSPAEHRVVCSCHTHAMQFTKWSDDQDFYVARWGWSGYDGPGSWRQRFRHIWRIVRKGTPYEDDFSVSPEDARKMAWWLLSQLGTSTTVTNSTLTTTSGYWFVPQTEAGQ